MRKNGKTTRRVDECVQLLFEKGQIYIPKKFHLSKDYRFKKTDVFIALDPDYYKGIAQEHF